MQGCCRNLSDLRTERIKQRRAVTHCSRKYSFTLGPFLNDNRYHEQDNYIALMRSINQGKLLINLEPQPHLLDPMRRNEKKRETDEIKERLWRQLFQSVLMLSGCVMIVPLAIFWK